MAKQRRSGAGTSEAQRLSGTACRSEKTVLSGGDEAGLYGWFGVKITAQPLAGSGNRKSNGVAMVSTYGFLQFDGIYAIINL